jgi:hypothetical protein
VLAYVVDRLTAGEALPSQATVARRFHAALARTSTHVSCRSSGLPQRERSTGQHAAGITGQHTAGSPRFRVAWVTASMEGGAGFFVQTRACLV